MLSRPILKGIRVDEKSEDLRQPALVLIETDKAGKSLPRVQIGIGHPAFEKLVNSRFEVHQ